MKRLLSLVCLIACQSHSQKNFCVAGLFVLAVVFISCKGDQSVTPPIGTTPVASTTTTAPASSTAYTNDIRVPLSAVLGFSVVDTQVYQEKALIKYTTDSFNGDSLKAEIAFLKVVLTARQLTEVAYPKAPAIRVWYILHNNRYISLIGTTESSAVFEWCNSATMQFKYADNTLAKIVSDDLIKAHGLVVNAGGDSIYTLKIVK